MLRLLRIEKFLLIEDLELEFGKGLNVISGETGTGKSMTLSAINFVMGAQGNYEEGTAVELEMEKEGEEVILRREVKGARSRFFIDGRGSSLKVVKELIEDQVSLQGQNEFLKILREDFQLDFIDTFGGLLPIRSRLENLWSELQAVERELEDLRRRLREIEERREIIEFRAKEIEEIGVKAEEVEQLREQARRVKDLEKIRNYLWEAMNSLYQSDTSAYSRLGEALRSLSNLSEIDPSYSDVAGEVELLKDRVHEIFSLLSEKDIDLSPNEIDRINNLIFKVQEIERKYKKPYEEVVEETLHLKEELKEMESYELSLDEKERDIKALRSEVAKLAESLSQKRKEVAREIENSIGNYLAGLGLEKARISFSFERGKLSGKGFDRVRALFSSYGGEPKPLEQTASGGELSRLFLAISLIMPPTGTYIFDEVDAGISGETSLRVAKLLKDLARKMQVIVITHSPALCASGEVNFVTEKITDGKTARIVVKKVEGEEKVMEVARLMGARTESTLKGAKELIEMLR